MGTGGQVDEVIFLLQVEGIVPGEFEKHGVDLHEIPRVIAVGIVNIYGRRWRHLGNVPANALRRAVVFLRGKELKAVYLQVLMATQVNRRTPPLPTLRPFAMTVQHRAQKANDYGSFIFRH